MEEERHQEEPSERRWRRSIHALTHILIHPTTTPSLHSQLFVSTHLPSYLLHQNSDYPPLAPSFRWSLSLFLRRCHRRTSWRSKCPFQVPPPLLLSSAVEPAPESWGAEERRVRLRRRLRRGRLGIEVAPILGLTVPNLVLFSLLLWDPKIVL